MASRRLSFPLGAAVAAALAVAAPVAAAPAPEPTPEPPAPVALIPPLAVIGTVMAQQGSAPAGPFGLPDLSAHAPALLLGQNPEPAPPAAVGPAPAAGAVLPSLSAFNPDYLLAQNLVPAAPGEGAPAPGLGPSPDSPGTGRLSFLGRLYEMYQDGYLKGALLGQMPADEFGQPDGN